jgi:hypothetical protein
MELVWTLLMVLALVLVLPLTLLVWGWVWMKVLAHWLRLVKEKVRV